MAIKKRKRFTKENWMQLVASIRQQQQEVEPPKEKEEPKVEVHIHNNLPSFDREANSADIAMNRMMGNNRSKWRPV